MALRFSLRHLLALVALVSPAACGASDSSSNSDAAWIVDRDTSLSPRDAAGTTSPDLPNAQNDVTPAGVDATASSADATADSANAPFQPGPATEIIVNSSNTATFNLANGTWKIFDFETQAGQLYVISELTGATRGYLGTSPSVSPTSFDKATDPTTGVLTFTAAASRYYLAVGVSGAGVSGSFQVADGGKLLALGTTTLSLSPADAEEAQFVFRFPVTAGHGVVLNFQGPIQPELALSVAPRPERSTNGGFSYSDWGVGGSLPFNDEAIRVDQVANSTSGFYFVNIRVLGAITFTINITQSP